MERKELLSRLNAVAEPATSWMKSAQYRIENRKTLEYSQEIALSILRELRKQNKTQIDLATALGVSKQQVNKWVKGNENFTIDTIAKIDAVLGTKLLQISGEISKEEIVSKSYEAEIEKIEAVKGESRIYKSTTPIHFLRIEKDEYKNCSHLSLVS